MTTPSAESDPPVETRRARPSRPRPRIGLLLNALSYTYQNDILRGVHEELAAHDVDLCCFSGGSIVGAGSPRPSSIYELIGTGALDGMIVSSSTLANEVGSTGVADFCRRYPGLPICSIGDQLDDIPSLLIDNFVGVQEVTLHLIDTHERSRVAFVSGPSKNDESQRRLAAYKAALGARGLPIVGDLIIEGNFTHAAGVAAVERLFGEGPGCDAIVAANDWTALGALDALDRRGLRVPRDVSVIGFDDIDEARFSMPPLSTISQPIRELGKHAARLVLSRLAGEPVALSGTLPTRIRLRRSCGCFDGAAPAPHPAPHPTSPRGMSSLARDRRQLADRLARAMPETSGAGSDQDRAERLLTALCGDLAEGTDCQFLPALGDVLRGTASWGNVHAWHDTLTFLRLEVAEYLGRTTQNTLLDGLIEHAHVAVSAAAERGQGGRRLVQENLLRTLQQTAAALLTAVDIPSFSRALTESLPKIGIPGCAVVLQVGERLAADATARLVVAYDRERGLLLEEPCDARGEDLILPAQMSARRRTTVIQPLFVGNDVLGFSVLELGPLDGKVYEILREQVSAAVKGVLLFRTIVEEVTKREHAERARLEDEMKIATRIQTGILPKITSVPGLEIAATMLPATEVGGDYFDVLPFAGGCWLGIGDVAGHGLPTGLVMLMIQSIVAATTRCRSDASAAAVWEGVNNVLYDNVRRLQQDEYATLSIIRYESNGRLALAGAHEEIIIHRRDTGLCETLPLVGTWAGIMEVDDHAVPELSAELQPGDLMVLYTDGVIESLNGANEQFGVEQLCREVEAVAHRTVNQVRDHLIAVVQAWSVRQVDDVTIVVMRQRERPAQANTEPAATTA